MIRTLPKLALVLAWVITLAAALGGSAAAARASGQRVGGPAIPVTGSGNLPQQKAVPELKVELTSLRVTGSGAKATAVLRGRLTNTGVQPAFGVRVVLWRSADAISDPAVFNSVLSGQTEPWGAVLNNSPNHYHSITASDEAFNPGATNDFTVRGELTDLGFSAPGGIYPFGVQVRGTADASSNYQVLARTRTLFVNPPKTRLPLASVVLLSAVSTKVRPNMFADESLASELTGRLGTLVDLAARPGFSWLVDPALIDEVTDLADGYLVLDGAGTRPGTGQQAAQHWLQRFRALRDADGARTLFANPDVLGAERNGATKVLERSAVATARVPEVADLPLVVLPLGGVADVTTPAWLRGANADAIAVRTTERGPVLASGPAGSTLLRLAPPATAAGPGIEDGPVQRGQRQAAEAVLGNGLARLISNPEEAAADAAGSPRWLTRTALPELLKTAPAPPGAMLTLPPKPTTLPAARFRLLANLTKDLAEYRELVPGSGIAADEPATLSRLISASWVDHAGPAAAWAGAVSDQFSESAVSRQVSLSASARVLMSSRSNEFPLTLSNKLSEPITLRVTFSSDNPRRIGITDTAPITVGPGQSQTVNVRPEASSNGLVNVTATLRTMSGKSVGHTTRIVVEVTDLGMIGWIIVVVSGVVLLATTALRIRQVRRKQREEEH